MPADQFPTLSNLLPWLVGTVVLMFGGMLLWVRQLVDKTISALAGEVSTLREKLVEGQHKIHEDNIDLAVALTILSLAIKSPTSDVREMADSHLKKLEAKRDAK